MNLLGIDFEDWYHPELIQQTLGKEKKIPKVINGLDKILDLLRKNETFATFFVVGELIEFRPEIQDKILNDGHEIGFHTMYHTNLNKMNSECFDNEVKRFAEITNKKSRGFRAPTFSLNSNTSWSIDILERNNYIYDSSMVPAKTGMYGDPNAEIKPYKISSSSLSRDDPAAKIIEFPLMITSFLGRKIPTGGGFFLRTLPFKITKKAIYNYQKKHIPSTFYVHSWELTPEFMPRIKLTKRDNFITYHNIQKVMKRMNELLSNFQFTSFEKYLNKIN